VKEKVLQEAKDVQTFRFSSCMKRKNKRYEKRTPLKI
jgi:hypothetical protein